MKKKKKTGSGNGKKLANLLTASLALSPVLHVLPYPASSIHAAPVTPIIAPYMKKPIPDVIAGTGKTLTLDLMQYFDSVDNFTLTTGGLEGFNAQVNGSMLTLTGGGTGTATVSVTGKNGSYSSVTDTFHVSVVPDTLDQDQNTKIELGEVAAYLNTHQTIRSAANQMLGTVSPQNVPPAINIPPRAKAAMLSVEKNSSLTINPGTLFDDSDQLTLDNYNISPTGFVSVLSAGSDQLTLLGVQQGTVTLDVTASDGQGGKAGSRYTVSVTDSNYNNVPYWTGGLSNITVTKNTYFSPAIDLKNVFVDPDGDGLQFNPVQISGESIQTLQSGSILNIFGRNGGTSTVTASVYDGKGGTATGSFNVKVNQPPELIGSPISSMSIYHNNYAHVPVSNRFSDPDNDTLNYTATMGSGEILTVTMAMDSGTTYANISGLPMGTNTVTLKAQDNYGGSVTDSFAVNVLNRAPVASAIADQTTTMGNPLGMDLVSYFSDPDMDTLSYSVISSNSAAVSAVIASGHLNLLPITRGTSVISLTATDSFVTVETTFNVTINNSDPQILPSLPAKAIPIDNLAVVTANEIFGDADGDMLQFTTFGLSTTGLACVSLVSGVLSVRGTGYGTVTVTVVVSDGHTGTKSGSFDVSVVNSPPIVLTSYSHRALLHGPPIDFYPDNYFRDHDVMRFTFGSTNSSIAHLYEDGGYHLSRENIGGPTTLAINAYDDNGHIVSSEIVVDVYDPTNHYVIDVPYYDSSSYNLDLASVFTPAISSPSYTITTDGSYPDLFTTQPANSSNITLTRKEPPYIPGTTTITVNVTDTSGILPTETKYIVVNYFQDDTPR